MMSSILIPHHQGQNRFLFLGTFGENRMSQRWDKPANCHRIVSLSPLCPAAIPSRK